MNNAPDEYKRAVVTDLGDDLKGKPIADKIIADKKLPPKPPMKPPEKAKPHRKMIG